MIRNSRYDLHASVCETCEGQSLTIQGQAQSIYDLFQKMVLGQYLPSSPSSEDYDFDTREGFADLDSVDDSLNRSGFFREEAFDLQQKYASVGKEEFDKSQKKPSEPQKSPSEPQTPPDSTPV